MWFSASLSVSPSAMLWWSPSQFMKAMIRVRSASVKPSARSRKRCVAATSWLLSTTCARRSGRSLHAASHRRAAHRRARSGRAGRRGRAPSGRCRRPDRRAARSARSRVRRRAPSRRRPRPAPPALRARSVTARICTCRRRRAARAGRGRCRCRAGRARRRRAPPRRAARCGCRSASAAARSGTFSATLRSAAIQGEAMGRGDRVRASLYTKLAIWRVKAQNARHDGPHACPELGGAWPRQRRLHAGDDAVRPAAHRPARRPARARRPAGDRGAVRALRDQPDAAARGAEPPGRRRPGAAARATRLRGQRSQRRRPGGDHAHALLARGDRAARIDRRARPQRGKKRWCWRTTAWRARRARCATTASRTTRSGSRCTAPSTAR